MLGDVSNGCVAQNTPRIRPVNDSKGDESDLR